MGVTGVILPVRVSCSFSGRPEAGSGEIDGEVQESTARSYGGAGRRGARAPAGPQAGRGSGTSEGIDHSTGEQGQQDQTRYDAIDHEHEV